MQRIGETRKAEARNITAKYQYGNCDQSAKKGLFYKRVLNVSKFSRT